MKKLLTLSMILLCVICKAQKINSCTYKKVDSLIKYKNAETITYKKDGKPITDTIYFSKMVCDIKIKEVGIFILNEDIFFK